MDYKHSYKLRGVWLGTHVLTFLPCDKEDASNAAVMAACFPPT